jgi:hypothetical protein
MALVVATLKTQIKAAFQTTDWAVCATQLASAIDNFIKTATTTTTVTANIQVPPSTVVATGLANTIATTGLAAMQSAILAKFQSPSTLWADLGSAIATAISTNVKTGTVTTTVTGAASGVGTGVPGCVNDSSGLSGLIANITTAFTTQAFSSDWNIVADKIGDSIDQYLKAATVTTVDSGAIPSSWSGSGIGKIS